MKILLIEDEEELSAIISRGLRKCGYAVDVAYDGEEAIAFYNVSAYDVIVLDLNLPKMDGIEVLSTIRKRDLKTKILVLSARSAVEERVRGLDKGANDYMVKPFDFLELEARIRTLSRIVYIQQGTELSCDGLRLNMVTKMVCFNENKISLTKKEYSIIEYMMFYKGEVISADQLLNHVWDSDADLYPESLKYHISSIKKKLSQAACNPDIIQNVRGMGYKIGELES